MPHLATFPESSVLWIGIAVAALILLVLVFVLLRYANLYVQALVSGAKTGITDLIGMDLRPGINPRTIVYAKIQAARAGLNVNQQEMESHTLAGGNLMRVINAMIAANKANIDLPWDTATAIDLAGRDIYDAIRTSVLPKVIDVPSKATGSNTLDAVAADGIQLKVRANVNGAHQTSSAWSAGRPRRRSSPAWARASSRRLARATTTGRC